MRDFAQGQTVVCRDDFDTFNNLKTGKEYVVERVKPPFLVLQGVSVRLPQHVRGWAASRFDPVSTPQPNVDEGDGK